MNRRKFFNMLGAATLGTIIALKIPETIAPINNWISKPKITFTALLDAYRKCCKGNIEPVMILLNKDVYADIVEQIKPHLRRTKEVITNPIFGTETIRENMIFMNASLIPNGFGQEENEIQIITNGKTFGNMGGRFYFN